MDENEGHGGGYSNKQFSENNFSKKEDDDDVHNDGNVDEFLVVNEETGFKNEEEIEKNSVDEVPQLMHHQPEDVTGSGERKFENNGSVEANINGEFRVNKMDGRGSVGRNESEQLSGGAGEGENVALMNEIEPNQRTGQRHPRHAGSTSHVETNRTGVHGTVRYDENVLNQGIEGTPPTLHSELGRIRDLSPTLEMPVVQMDSYTAFLGAPMPPFYEIFIPFLTNIGLPDAAPYVNPAFFMPSSAHIHTTGMLPHPRIGETPSMLHPEFLHNGPGSQTRMVQMGSYRGVPGAPMAMPPPSSWILPSFPFFGILGFHPIMPNVNPSFFMARSRQMSPGPSMTGRSGGRMREISDRDQAMSHDQCRQVCTDSGRQKAKKRRTRKPKAVNSDRKSTHDDEKPNCERNIPQQKGMGDENENENNGPERQHNETDNGRNQDTDQDCKRPQDLDWEYEWV